MATKKKRERLPEVIRDNWEVRDWTQKDAYGTTEKGVTIYRRFYSLVTYVSTISVPLTPRYRNGYGSYENTIT